MFALLDEQNIKIHAFRADGASYQMNGIETISKNVEKLYIRLCMRDALAREIASIDNWEQVNLGTEMGYRGEIECTPFINTAKRNKTLDQLKSYRLVVTKMDRSDKLIDLFTNEAYKYSAILTK